MGGNGAGKVVAVSLSDVLLAQDELDDNEWTTVVDESRVYEEGLTVIFFKVVGETASWLRGSVTIREGATVSSELGDGWGEGLCTSVEVLRSGESTTGATTDLRAF
jgi:hypothetical protein